MELPTDWPGGERRGVREMLERGQKNTGRHGKVPTGWETIRSGLHGEVKEAVQGILVGIPIIHVAHDMTCVGYDELILVGYVFGGCIEFVSHPSRHEVISGTVDEQHGKLHPVCIVQRRSL